MELVSDSEGTLYTVLLQEIHIITESTDDSKTILSMLKSNNLKTAGISFDQNDQ
jgi:hypothetical protein